MTEIKAAQAQVPLPSRDVQLKEQAPNKDRGQYPTKIPQKIKLDTTTTQGDVSRMNITSFDPLATSSPVDSDEEEEEEEDDGLIIFSEVA